MPWGAEREAGGMGLHPRVGSDPVCWLLQTDPGARDGPHRRCQSGPGPCNGRDPAPRAGRVPLAWAGMGSQEHVPCHRAGRSGSRVGAFLSEPQGMEGEGKGSQASCKKLLLTKVPFKRQRLVPCNAQRLSKAAPRGSRGLAHLTR